MRITKEKLKSIIREELNKYLSEHLSRAMKYTSSAPADERYTALGPETRFGSDPGDTPASLSGGEETSAEEPQTQGEARRQARARGELTYTWQGKKLGTRGSAEEDKAAFRRKMARIRARRQYDEEGVDQEDALGAALEDSETGGLYNQVMTDVEPTFDTRLATNQPRGGSSARPSVATAPKQAGPGDTALTAAVARERIKAAEKKIADRIRRMKAKDPFFDPGEDSRIARWQGAIARQKAKSAIASPSLRENKKITNSSLKKLIRNILRTDYE